MFKELTNIINNFDSSTFISETPPEGLPIKNHSTFTKKWVIKNSGNVAWEKRFMKQDAGANDMFQPRFTKIEMPLILPNENYVFIVEYECKHDGDYYSNWKMVHEADSYCFPTEYIGLWVNAHIRN